MARIDRDACHPAVGVVLCGVDLASINSPVGPHDGRMRSRRYRPVHGDDYLWLDDDRRQSHLRGTELVATQRCRDIARSPSETE